MLRFDEIRRTIELASRIYQACNLKALLEVLRRASQGKRTI